MVEMLITGVLGGAALAAGHGAADEVVLDLDAGKQILSEAQHDQAMAVSRS